MEFELNIHTIKYDEEGKPVKMIGKRNGDFKFDTRLVTVLGNVFLNCRGKGHYEVEYMPNAHHMYSMMIPVRGKKLADGVYRFYNERIA